MILPIKYKGMFASKDEENYICGNWNEDDIIKIMINYNLNTKEGIVSYLSEIKIHPDSIINFIILIKYAKKKIKERKDDENSNKKIIRKEVEKYFKKW